MDEWARMKIKRSNADKHFSNAVREASNWVCSCCGKQSPNCEYGMMDNAHCFSRRHRFTRWHPTNTTTLCRACHLRQTDTPDEHVTFWRNLLGEDYNLMRELSQTMQKVTKKDELLIVQHYKDEMKRIKELRMKGNQGNIKLNIPEVLL